MNKITIKKFMFALCGLVWPFLVAAVYTIIHVHIRAIPNWYFLYIALPFMALGLIPVAIFIAHSLHSKLPVWLRWLVSMIITAVIGCGLCVLIGLFGYWFHFAVGGSC